jgi:hypothetical protein
MYADEEQVTAFAWPLKKGWYPSEQGSLMLDKLWSVSFNHGLVVKV